MATPLYDALVARAERDTARFHMPGHKGRAVTPALKSMTAMDFTELPDTGDLYAGGDVIEAAEALWAAAWGFARCQFLTGGSTQGLHAALLLAARRGRRVLVDRRSHRSVYNALGLFDLAPVYLPGAQDRPTSPAAVAEALDAAGGSIKTVCITSPTYYGVLSDIPALARVIHERGAMLIVDGAHGAHLPFLGDDPFAGADLVVTSAHKTLPVYGQGALLFAGEETSARDLRWAAGVCGTSSPSYPVMASMDYARAWMAGPGRAEYENVSNFVEKCRKTFPALSGDGLDPTRLTVLTRPGAGFAAAEEWEAEGVACEMADADHVVFILTGADKDEDLARLWRALAGSAHLDPAAPLRAMEVPPTPEAVLSPAEALRAVGVPGMLDESAGRVCLEQVAPYPPGVPVIAPGERITKKCLAYLAQVGYNVHREVYLSAEEARG